MRTHRQAGYVNALLLWLIVAVVLFAGAAVFGVWAFMGRQDYKENSDQKVVAASAQTKKDTEAADAVLYAEAAKNPLKTYVGPSQYGSVTIFYPKTWSAYIIEGTKTPADYYFHPDTVPDIQGKESAYSLRVAVVEESYDTVLNAFAGSIKENKAKVTPYSLPKVPSVIGSRVEGEIGKEKQGTMIVLPLRNLTLEIWTEAAQYQADFNNIILPNLTFSP